MELDLGPNAFLSPLGEAGTAVGYPGTKAAVPQVSPRSTADRIQRQWNEPCAPSTHLQVWRRSWRPPVRCLQLSAAKAEPATGPITFLDDSCGCRPTVKEVGASPMSGAPPHS